MRFYNELVVLLYIGQVRGICLEERLYRRLIDDSTMTVAISCLHASKNMFLAGHQEGEHYDYYF